jgi:acyl-CoA thioesterase-2
MARDRPSLFGGQVAAQALMAAGLTVPDALYPHSLHGYFLRPGQTDRPVILQVNRDRDGRSFSARHVAAVQDGEVIFSMLASFHLGDGASVFDEVDQLDVRAPEESTPVSSDSLLEIRHVTLNEVVDGHQRYSDCMWIRAAHLLPDDRLTQACALTYLSDLGTGFGQVLSEVMGTGGPSLDHALWFHEPIRADEWVLLRLWPAKAIAARGVYHGALRDQSGRLGGMLAQEHLLRGGGALDTSSIGT